jgi:hypothetical protein
MKLINMKKLQLFVGTLLVSSALTFNPLQAGISDKISDYFKDFPGIGLVSDEITYGPVTVSHIHINHADKLAIASPGEQLHGSLKYKIDSTQSNLDLHHLIIGIKGIGPQDCVMHSLDIFNSKGKGTFTLTAPSEPGVYEVRILYNEGLICSDAWKDWNNGSKRPSHNATVGIIVVN